MLFSINIEKHIRYIHNRLVVLDLVFFLIEKMNKFEDIFIKLRTIISRSNLIILSSGDLQTSSNWHRCQSSSRSALWRSTGNNVSCHYKKHNVPVSPSPLFLSSLVYFSHTGCFVETYKNYLLIAWARKQHISWGRCPFFIGYAHFDN